MYAASCSPRFSSMSRRISSSSRPSASTSASVRCANSLTSVMAICPHPSDIESAVTSSSGDAGLDVLVLGVLVAVAEVLHPALLQRDHAGVADAHAAAERHLDALGLARLHQGGGAVDVGFLAGGGEDDAPALGRLGQLCREPLEMQLLAQAAPGPMLLRGVEHWRWPAYPRLALAPVRHDLGQFLYVQAAVSVVVVLDELQRGVLVGQRMQLVAEDDLRLRRSRVHMDDVGHRVASM